MKKLFKIAPAIFLLLFGFGSSSLAQTVNKISPGEMNSSLGQQIRATAADIISQMRARVSGVSNSESVTAPILERAENISNLVKTRISEPPKTDPIPVPSGNNNQPATSTNGQTNNPNTPNTPDPNTPNTPNPNTPPSNPGSIFQTGAVSLRFDDNWASQYTTALPILTKAGLKGTFYVATKQIADLGYSGYMSKAQIQSVASSGQEIGSHTRNHVNLTKLSSADAEQQIIGSRQDLLSWNVGPVTSFDYPFGSFNSDIKAMVKKAGYTNAAATISGYNSSNTDPYALMYEELHANTTLAQVEDWINSAISQKKWLILTFHQIDNGGREYSTTPAKFQAIIDYLKSKNVSVVTVSQGAGNLAK